MTEISIKSMACLKEIVMTPIEFNDVIHISKHQRLASIKKRLVRYLIKIPESHKVPLQSKDLKRV